MNYREANISISHDYDVEITGDGSPTLRPQKKESMHHMGGAAGESVYIYYEALVRYFQLPSRKAELSVLSFGFGMGYNEILAVLFFLKNRLSLGRLSLFSHEKDLFLYELFNFWLKDSASADSVFDEVYAGIERALATIGPPISKAELKDALGWILESKKWSQLGPVTTVDDFTGLYDIVFFDAFSAKTNDYLWTESFLSDFFKAQLNPVFVFSTYACTGVLKRVAVNCKADFVKRDGYQGKRNASLIFRS